MIRGRLIKWISDVVPSNKTFVTLGDQRNNVASVLAVHYEYGLKPLFSLIQCVTLNILPQRHLVIQMGGQRNFLRAVNLTS